MYFNAMINMTNMSEIRLRSLIKAATWRIAATVTTVLIAYIFTGSWPISLGIGFAEVLSKIAIYYFHERLWNKIKWGVK